jgi:hypothetical protein
MRLRAEEKVFVVYLPALPATPDAVFVLFVYKLISMFPGRRCFGLDDLSDQLLWEFYSYCYSTGTVLYNTVSGRRIIAHLP